MKHVLQNLRTGITEIVDVPQPQVKANHVLIQTSFSLISAGTERMLVDFGKANLINKARQQPEKVRMVLDKVKTDGLLATLDAVQSKLDLPMPMGYCNVGKVIAIGQGVTHVRIGDIVVSNGPHAEMVNVPKNLCVPVPSSVQTENASFAILGAIGLQGIRLLNPTLGEVIAVTGMGLIGLLAVQLLRAQGCKVLAIDYDAERLALAEQFGAMTVNLAQDEDALKAAEIISRGRGLDGVLICASTSSNEPIEQATKMCRKRGRIVLVGVTGMELSRKLFYDKELSFQVSCSYGPGRYDKHYEEEGHDYPHAYVRWTEQRNIEAVLDMMAEGHLNISPLISHRFNIENAADAYQLISERTPSLGILIDYPITLDNISPDTIHVNPKNDVISQNAAVKIGFIGAGNYATQILIPAFKKTSAELVAISSQSGMTTLHPARKFGIQTITTNVNSILDDPLINTLVVNTRHNSHAHWTCRGLQANKHVFVEKPLALTQQEINEIISAHRDSKGNLMVGFNRRFAPHVQKIKSLLQPLQEPKTIIMTMNAGFIPDDHWTQDLNIGGGRILGEACHFIDLMRYLVGSPIVDVQATKMSSSQNDDKATITLKFADGSIGSIHYFANGHRSFPKERIEIFCAGRILQLNNFIKLIGYGWPKFKKMSLWRQDKGQSACAAAFVNAIQQGHSSPIAFDELIEVARVTVAVAEDLQHCV